MTGMQTVEGQAGRSLGWRTAAGQESETSLAILERVWRREESSLPTAAPKALPQSLHQPVSATLCSDPQKSGPIEGHTDWIRLRHLTFGYAGQVAGLLGEPIAA